MDLSASLSLLVGFNYDSLIYYSKHTITLIDTVASPLTGLRVYVKNRLVRRANRASPNSKDTTNYYSSEKYKLICKG